MADYADFANHIQDVEWLNPRRDIQETKSLMVEKEAEVKQWPIAHR